MTSHSAITEVVDLGPFSWIEDDLRSQIGMPPAGDTALRTVDMVPPRFAAYAKVLHEMYEDPKRRGDHTTWDDVLSAGSDVAQLDTASAPSAGWQRLRWADLATRLGLPFDGATTEADFARAWPTSSWPASILGPEEGDLGQELLSAVTEALESTSGNQPCYFWWWLVACIGSFGGEDVRDHLFRGTLRDLPEFVAQRDVYTPTYWWPEDRSWCVATSWDLCFTVIGGSDELIQAVLANRAVEGVRIGERDALLRYKQR